VQAVSGRCNKCGGEGHWARECPSKGDGKGKGGKGKGFGKGPSFGKGLSVGKGKGKGVKGKGKGKSSGFQGDCWSCGKFGHSASNCRSTAAVWQEQGPEEETAVAPVDSVWEMGAVWLKPETKRYPLTRNMFSALSCDEGDDDGTGSPQVDADRNLDFEKSVFRKMVQPKKVSFKNDVGHLRTSCSKFGHNSSGYEPSGEAHRAEAHRAESVDKQVPRTQTNATFICAIKADDPLHDKAEDASMRFQVADVCKPLASAAKVVKHGNRVVLSQGESFVENLVSKKRWPLRLEGETYVFDVVIDGRKETITLDSGAGVSVCPIGWGGKANVDQTKKVKMIAANGSGIFSRGEKVVRFHGQVGA